FDGASPKRCKENIGWHAAEILNVGLQAVQIGVLLCCRQLGERRLGLELRIDRSERSPVEFGGREGELVALARSAGLPGAAAVKPLASAPRAIQLLVNIIRNASFESARPFVVRWDKTRNRSLDEGCFFGVEE